jgi:hypothetical protein
MDKTERRCYNKTAKKGVKHHEKNDQGKRQVRIARAVLADRRA